MRIRATGPHVGPLCLLCQEDKTTHLGKGPGPAPDTHAALVQLTTYTTAQGSPSWPTGSSQGTCCYSNKRAGSHSLRDTVRKEQRELDMGAATFLCWAGGGTSTRTPAASPNPWAGVHGGPSPRVRTPRCNSRVPTALGPTVPQALKVISFHPPNNLFSKFVPCFSAFSHFSSVNHMAFII